MACQCSFINCNKRTTLVGDVDSWGGCVGGAGGTWELSAQFCCEPTTALKNKVCILLKTINSRGFPGGAVVKNLPANAGDMGSSLGRGRSHMLQSN